MNRLNVYWQGRRTTARFDSRLWNLAKLAFEMDDDSLANHVKQSLLEERLQRLASDQSASEIVNAILMTQIELVVYAKVNDFPLAS